MKIVINPIDKILLSLLSKHLFDSNEEIDLEGVDLKELFKEAKHQTIVAMTFDKLPKTAAKIDTETYVSWQTMSFTIMKGTLKNNFNNAELTKLLKENNIDHCTIKGYTSAYYYPNPTLRQMGDIDFLINPEDSEKTINVLVKNGFNVVECEEHDFHIGLAKNKAYYEMHTNVTHLPEDKQHLFKYLDNALTSKRVVNASGGEIYILDEVHHGITMLLHMQRHMTEGSGIGLRHLADWAVFVNSIENDCWIEKFETVLKAMGLWKFAKAISMSCAIYLKMPKKQWFENTDIELSENLIYDIIQSGNFGRKEAKERYQQKMFNNQKYKDKNAVSRFILTVRDNIFIWSPFYENHKWLLPIGFISYCFRILIQILFKNKRIKIFKIYSDGKKQYDTYSKLDFFEEDKT